MLHVNSYFLPLLFDGVEGANVGGAEQEDDEEDEKVEEVEEENEGEDDVLPLQTEVMDRCVAKFFAFLTSSILVSTPVTDIFLVSTLPLKFLKVLLVGSIKRQTNRQ